MKFRSFRQRLNAAFLLASLVPTLLCSALLLQVFRIRMGSTQTQAAQQQLTAAEGALDRLSQGLREASQTLDRSPWVTGALLGEEVEDANVNNLLFQATDALRSCAVFQLYDISGSCRYSTRSAPSADGLPTAWGVLYAAAQAPGDLVFYPSEDPSSQEAPALRCAALLSDAYGAPAGYLVVDFWENQLETLLGSLAGAQNELLLVDRLWRSVYCTQPTQVLTLAEVLRGQLLAGKPLTGEGDQFLYTVRQNRATGLYLILQQPQLFTPGTLRLLYTVSILCALCCVLLSVTLGLRLSHQLFEPIGKLHRAIRRVEKNDLQVQVPVPQDRQDELTELATQFNHMVTSLEKNQQELLENQKALNEAQIRMLQAQLNPHFLCNTLDTMKWISKINQVPQVALMSTNLADILRFCISPAEFVPLRREMEILERYVEIQRIRLSDSFAYEAQVPEELLDCLVPKMLLQPLAENAILHGLSGSREGTLTVTAQGLEGDILEIRVADNGAGLPPELLGPYRPPEQPTGHLGLLNVDTILRKHYGEHFGLRLENRKECAGACVIARLPIRKGENPC